jgi:hypothetical protein
MIMTRKILAVGLELATNLVHVEQFGSKISLLDWDIILFRPDIENVIISSTVAYQGKPCLGDSASFRLKEACEHWRREIRQAFDNGKTTIVFLPAVEEVYVATGERTSSGTGRNQKVTRIVERYSNYNSLPVSLKPVPSIGSSIKLAPLGAEILAPFWLEFEKFSTYKVLISPESKESIALTTKAGDKPVGAIFRSKISSGAIVLLPDMDFHDDDSFLAIKGKENHWTDEAEQFAARLAGAAVSMSRALHSSGDATPEPAWAAAPIYTLASERELGIQLLNAEHQVEEV